MRRALGLDGGSAAPRPAQRPTQRPAELHTPTTRHRHRFVNDGDVPVVVVHSRPDQPPPSRPDRSAVQLEHERIARERSERALSAANARLRDMETQLVHVTLARDEALASLREAHARLAAAVTPPRVAAPVAPAATAADPAANADAPPPVKRRRGRPPKVRTEATAPKPRKAAATPRGKAPQPVKWWVKGWRETVAE